MTTSKFLIIPILTFLLLLMDMYVWQGVKVVFRKCASPIRRSIKIVFWGFSLMAIPGLWAYNFIPSEIMDTKLRTLIVSGLFVIYGAKLFTIPIIFFDDMYRLYEYVRKGLLQRKKRYRPNINTHVITRSDFLMQTAIMAAAIPAGALTWGILSGAHDYQVKRIPLLLKNLPRAFEGMIIAQISDIHSGSFFNKTAVLGGVEMLLKEKSDMVFFYR